MGDECRKAFEAERAKTYQENVESLRFANEMFPGQSETKQWYGAYFFHAAWNRRPAPQPDKALVLTIGDEIYRAVHRSSDPYNPVLEDKCHDIARRLADRFGGWVSVEERLPGEPCCVNAFGGGEVIGCVYADGEFHIWTADGLVTFDNVTHWRPLPAPPEVK